MSSSATKLYIGRVSPRTSQRTLERLFEKYGRVVSLTIKGDFGFVEFEDDRDADDAIHYLDGENVDGQRIVVERSRSRPYDRGGGGGGGGGGYGGDRGGGDRGSRTFSAQDKCYNCGMIGHWANECRSRDWGNRCYNCGGGGHIRSQCPDPPKGGGFGARDKEVDPRAGSGRRGGPPPSRGRGGGGGGGGRDSRSRSRGRGRGDGYRSRTRSRSRSRGGRDSRSRSRGRDRSGSRSPRRSPSRSPKRSASPGPRDD